VAESVYRDMHIDLDPRPHERPAVVSGSTPMNVGVIVRPDGSHQVTYDATLSTSMAKRSR